MENRKYYNFETRFISLRDNLRKFLKNNNIYYELSGGASFYHFEILATYTEAEKINDYLDTIIITEAWNEWAQNILKKC